MAVQVPEVHVAALHVLHQVRQVQEVRLIAVEAHHPLPLLREATHREVRLPVHVVIVLQVVALVQVVVAAIHLVVHRVRVVVARTPVEVVVAVDPLEAEAVVDHHAQAQVEVEDNR